MAELHLNGKSADGTRLIFIDTDGNEFTADINQTLRAAVNQPRLTSVPEPDVESISIKEIQRRLRAGISADEIARENNISLEKIERFSGPITQERRYIIDQAQQIILRKEGEREPTNFLSVVAARLAPHSVDISELLWLTWRLEDATWIIELHYPSTQGQGLAQFSFDPSRRSITSIDENASWIFGEEAPVRAPIEVGLIYNGTPYAVRSNEPVRATPRLAVAREEPDAEAMRDGIIARAKVPSWDEIMFGIKPSDSE